MILKRQLRIQLENYKKVSANEFGAPDYEFKEQYRYSSLDWY
jgi:hypothetical protein